MYIIVIHQPLTQLKPWQLMFEKYQQKQHLLLYFCVDIIVLRRWLKRISFLFDNYPFDKFLYFPCMVTNISSLQNIMIVGSLGFFCKVKFYLSYFCLKVRILIGFRLFLFYFLSYHFESLLFRVECFDF